MVVLPYLEKPKIRFINLLKLTIFLGTKVVLRSFSLKENNFISHLKFQNMKVSTKIKSHVSILKVRKVQTNTKENPITIFPITNNSKPYHYIVPTTGVLCLQVH